MEGIFEVKGEATDASPILTMGSSKSLVFCISSIIAAIIPADPARVFRFACLALIFCASSASFFQIACIAFTIAQLSPFANMSSYILRKSSCFFLTNSALSLAISLLRS